MTIRDRWNDTHARVARACDRVGRNVSDVKIVAVSKTVTVEKIREAYDAGARIFGENYVQEALPKIQALRTEGITPEWHFIGALQSNKAKKVIGKFGLIHSLDRWSLAEALEKARRATESSIRALVEVNVAGETSKSGVAPDRLRELFERISKETEIDVVGLMAFPPPVEDPEMSRGYFRRAKELAQEAAGWKLPRVTMNELSMGVTSDFEVAIEEGATLVRIGTAIFGPRQ